MKSQFDVGEMVSIYEDPITRKKLEGVATLKKLINANFSDAGEGLHLERWEVEFENDPGRTFPRNILVDSSLSKPSTHPAKGDK